MADREKVIKGLKCCKNKTCDYTRPDVLCPYIEWLGEHETSCYECTKRLADDVLSLLKAQEPKPPRFTVAYDKIFYGCDNCGKSLVVMANSEGLVLQKYAPKYCSECGQAVKWE